MTKQMPPMPPASRSNKGPGNTPEGSRDDRRDRPSAPDNLAEQDRQGNIKQNTTNQGYQQDR